MNKIELKYPNWDRYNKDIAGKVMVAKNTVLPPDDPAYTDPINTQLSHSEIGTVFVKGYAAFEDLVPYMYEDYKRRFYNSPYKNYIEFLESLAAGTGTVRAFRNCIIGKCTGNYRVVDDFYLVEVDLYLHSWARNTGMVIKKLEINLQGFTDNTVEFMEESDVCKLGLDLSFDHGWRNMSGLGYGYGNYDFYEHSSKYRAPDGSFYYHGDYIADLYRKSIDPDYLDYSDVQEMLIKFGGKLTNEYLKGQRFDLEDLYMLNYKSKMDSEIIYKDAKNTFLDGSPPKSSWIKIQPLWSWVGGVPTKVRVLAHKTNPNPVIGGTGVLESKLFENRSWKNWPIGYREDNRYKNNTHDESYVAITGLEAGVNYYFRTYIEYSPLSLDGQSFDLDTTSEWYSDSAQLSAFTGVKDPILYFGAKWPVWRDVDYLTFRMAWIKGDPSISSAGIVYCKTSLGRSPNLNTDPYIELNNIGESEEITISGLLNNESYWFKTYIILSDNRVIYPIIEKGGYEFTGPGYMLWDGDCIAYTRNDSAVAGTVNITDIFRVEDTSIGMAIQVMDDGGSSIIEGGVCYSKLPMPTTANNKKIADFYNGPSARAPFDITDLDPATKYYFRPYAISYVGTWYGAQKEITTSSGPIRITAVRTLAPDKITFNSAELKLEVTDNLNVIEKGFVWRSGIASPTLSDTVITSDDISRGIFSSNITGLSPKTVYSYRAFVRTNDGYVWGEHKTFTTLNVSDSSVITNTPSTVLLGSLPAQIHTEFITSVEIESVGSLPITSIGIVLSDRPIDSSVDPFTYTLKYQIGNATTPGKYGIKITGLTLGKVYHIAAFCRSNQTNFGYSKSVYFKTEDPSSGTAESNKISIGMTSFTKGVINLESSIINYTGKILRAGIAMSTSLIVDPEGSVDDLSLEYKEVNEQFINNFPSIKKFLISFSGLQAGTAYYFASYYQTPLGWTWSNTLSAVTTGEITSFSFANTVPIITDYSFTMSSTVSDESKIEVVGYQWSTDESSWNTVQLSSWKSGPIVFTFNKETVGNYYIKSFVKLVDGSIYTSSTYLFKVTKEKEYSNFSPPSNAEIGEYYEHTFNGTTRKWKKNEEGWQRIIELSGVKGDVVTSSSLPALSRVNAQKTTSDNLLEIVPNYHETSLLKVYPSDLFEDEFYCDITLLEPLKWDTIDINWVLSFINDVENLSLIISNYNIWHTGNNTYKILLNTPEQINMINTFENISKFGDKIKISREGIADDFITVFKNNSKIKTSSIITLDGSNLNDVIENNVISAFTSPSSIPDRIGQRWFNKGTKDTYTAFGTDSISDWVLDGKKTSYKVYSFTVSQTSTLDPTHIVLDNTLLSEEWYDGVWSRTGVGVYELTFDSVLNPHVHITSFTCPQANQIIYSPAGKFYFTVENSTDVGFENNRLVFKTYLDSTNTLTDGLFTNQYIKLIV